MTNVIDIEREAAAGSMPALAGIRQGSRALAMLFTVLLVTGAAILAMLVGAVLVYSGDRLQLCSRNAWIGVGSAAAPPGCRVLSSLPATQRLAYALVAIVRAAPALMILWNLRTLFRRYADGMVFARDNAARLKSVGVWLIAAAFAPLLCHLVLTATGNEIDKNWMHLASVQELVLGALVLVISQVMQAAHHLEEEQRRFV